MHGVTDAEWDDLIAELTNAEVERYPELYQGVVDEYLASH